MGINTYLNIAKRKMRGGKRANLNYILIFAE